MVVGLNLDPKQREQAIGELMKLPQARELREVTGRFDAFLTLRGRTIEELHKATSDVIGRIPGRHAHGDLRGGLGEGARRSATTSRPLPGYRLRNPPPAGRPLRKGCGLLGYGVGHRLGRLRPRRLGGPRGLRPRSGRLRQPGVGASRGLVLIAVGVFALTTAAWSRLRRKIDSELLTRPSPSGRGIH